MSMFRTSEESKTGKTSTNASLEIRSKPKLAKPFIERNNASALITKTFSLQLNHPPLVPSRCKVQIENNYFDFGRNQGLSARHSQSSISSSSSLERDSAQDLLTTTRPLSFQVPTLLDPSNRKLENDVKIQIVAYDSVKIVKQRNAVSEYFQSREQPPMFFQNLIRKRQYSGL